MPPDAVLEPMALSLGAYALVFVVGALFGSFANVCIYRMPPTLEHPRGRSVVRPGSHCGACGNPVRWYDNIPLVSYALLRGACRDCGARFSPRYLLVEAATGMLFVAVYHLTVGLAYVDDPLALRSTRFLIYAALVFVLVVITFIDLDHKLILDKITYPAIPLFYALGTLLPENGWSEGLIGAAVGYGLIRLISDGYYYLTGREGLGYGDGKLLAIVGAVHGWQAVLVTLFFGSLLGSVIGIGALLVARRRAAGSTGAGSEPVGPEASGGAPAAGAAEPAADLGAEATGPAEDVPLRYAELPFGPFLAMGAISYLFVHPHLALGFAGLWG
jgi:leader peptidase (prepilin peptidase) / N-methyltransferase